MRIVNPDFIKGKKVLLRLDIDVPIKYGQIEDDFRLRAAIPTLQLCVQNASQVTILGHIGRPEGQYVEQLSVEPIHDWLYEQGFGDLLRGGRLQILENLRFEPGEESLDINYARELASFGEVFINEAFASHHAAASTTVLPQLLPHAAGLRFAKEVEVLTRVRTNPSHPMVVLIGGVKIEDKFPAILALSEVADAVLVGGKVAKQLKQGGYALKSNIIAGRINEEGSDITEETVQSWANVLRGAKMVVWNGPLGYVEDPRNDKSKHIAQIIINSGAESILGGGDTINTLRFWGLIDKFSFVSTGGGAMLKFLAEGTLPTIEALK